MPTVQRPHKILFLLPYRLVYAFIMSSKQTVQSLGIRLDEWIVVTVSIPVIACLGRIEEMKRPTLAS